MVADENWLFTFLSGTIANQLFQRAGFDPIDRNKAATYVKHEASRIRACLIKELGVLRQKQAGFSLSLDEWTMSCKTFLGISIVCSEEIPVLKSRRIEFLERVDSTKSIAILSTVRSVLTQIGLRMEDISSIVTDGE